MKRLFYLMFLITAFANAQPDIQDPTPLQACDGNDDGIALFNMSQKAQEVLGGLSHVLFTVTFHETQMDAEFGGTSIAAPYSYMNIFPFTQTVYVRVTDNNDSSSYSVTTLQLIVNSSPVANTPSDLFVEDAPFDGVATFDLTSNDIIITNGLPDLAVSYYTSLANAENQLSPIVPATAYTGTNGQVIWVNLRNTVTGCYATTRFRLNVISSGFVFIPDATFKAQLIAEGYDTNTDGEIQYMEALAIDNLTINNSAIADLTGVLSFLNLHDFWCENTSVTTLNLSGLNSLTNVHCQSNPLLTSLDVSNLPSLTGLGCSFNKLNTLNLTGATSLTTLECTGNLLTTLNVSAFPQLVTLNCVDNRLTDLNFTNCPQLDQVECGGNLLTTLDLTGLALSINGLSPLSLYCEGNAITGFTFPQSITLNDFMTTGNQLTDLDLSHVKCQGGNWDFHNNPLLNINLKNGFADTFGVMQFADANDPLRFICADENELAVITNILDTNSLTGIAVNSYCSFAPGGTFNTVSGIVRLDSNTNGCDTSDVSMGLLGLQVSLDTLPFGAAYTNNAGNYSIYMSEPGTYTLNPILENPSYFTVAPVTVDATNINNAATVENICIVPNGFHSDAEVVIAPIAIARPGFEAIYQVVIKNKGNQVLSGNTTFTYNDAVLDYVSSDVVPIQQSLGLLTYTYAGLLPFQSRSIYIKLSVNAPTSIPPVNINDELVFSANVTTAITDEVPNDNSFEFHQTVVGSFDPNEITCIEGNSVSPTQIGNYLHYVINFENTGTAEAENIVVREVIDTNQFDINTMQLLNSSALLRTKVTGNVAEFIFQGINLHSGGHGNILLKIKSKNTLLEGDVVSKKANIYFDYNFPVATLPEDTVFQSLSSPGVPLDASISVYPNPTKGKININCNNTIKSLQLFDIQGRLLETNIVNETTTSIDISNQSAGIYFLKVLSDAGMKVTKIVRN